MGVQPPGAPAPEGPMGALRALGRTLNHVVRIRGELFAVELREEVARRGRLLVLAAVAFGFLHMALLLFTLLAIAAFWDTHRLAAIGAIATTYLAAGGAAWLRIRRELATNPAPFAATLEELDRDLAGLGRPS
jgi:uncharacterized membrane protein YqjE